MMLVLNTEGMSSESLIALAEILRDEGRGEDADFVLGECEGFGQDSEGSDADD